MLTYNYLKENPQLRHEQVTFDWHSLFTDPDTPYSVKEELKEIQSITATPTDSQLFWHQHMVMYRMLEDEKFHLDDYIWSSHWLEQLYTIMQQRDEFTQQFADICWRIILSIDTTSCNVKLSLKEVQKVINIYNERGYHGRSPSLSEACIMVICDFDRNTYTYSRIDNKICAILFRRCTMRFIRSISTCGRLIDICDMLSDTDEQVNPETGVARQFDSINEIQRIHDERTERETAKLMASCAGKHYSYMVAFKELIEEHNFFLPLGPGSLVERGKQHHNCVGTYDNKHLSNLTYTSEPEEAKNINGKVMRLIFSKTATIEVHFEVRHGLIVGTSIGQCKGQNNQNKELTEDLTNLQIALTGRSCTILRIEKREEYNAG